MEFAGDPESIAGDEDAIEDDRRAAFVVGDALGLERRHAGSTSELARLAPAEAHGGHALARALDRDAELEFEHLAQRRGAEIGLQHLLAEGGAQEGSLQAHRVAVDQAQSLELHDAGAGGEPERSAHAVVRARHASAEQPRGDVLALCRQITGKTLKLQDVVVDRGRRHERAETVAPRDQILALEHRERLAQRHQRHAERFRERALIVEPRARRDTAALNALTKRFGDSVITRHACVHADSSVGVLELYVAKKIAGAPVELTRATTKRI